MARATNTGGSKQPKQCKICQATAGVNGEPFVWRQLSPGVWRLYESDGADNPTMMHPCHAKLPATKAGAAPVAATAPATAQPATVAPIPGSVAGADAASGIQSGIASSPEAARAEAGQAETLPGSAANLADVYDMLDKLDQEYANREPSHESIGLSYADTVAAAIAIEAPEVGVTVDAPSTAITIKHGAFIPKVDPDYLIDTFHYQTIKAVIALADATGIPQNIGLHGPTGSGKTTMGIQIGAIRNRPTFVVDAATKQTADEWYGESTGIDRESGAITYRTSRFVEGIETPNSVVVINDVALMQNRTVQSGLNEMLDPTTRSAYIEHLGRTVRVAPGVIIVGTWNVGAEYTSASELSLQLISRFGAGALLEVGYPTEATLAKIFRARTGINKPGAARLAACMEWLRSDPDPILLDPRRMIQAAHLIVKGQPIGHAIMATALGELDASDKARAFGIIDVNLDQASAGEREQWATPTMGDYRPMSELSQ